MTFIITIKKEIQNEVSTYLEDVTKQITVTTLNISDGLLKKGSYYIPVSHILFIEEV